MNASDLVDSLGLLPHPEGGFYKETYRAPDVLPKAALAGLGEGRFGGDRAASTAIYFLLREGEYSALHRIASDEVWHFYAGSPLTIVVLHDDGRREDLLLGLDFARGAAPQQVVPAGAWFGSYVTGGAGFALVGCTVAPGFDFGDFELGTRSDLLERFPGHVEVVRALTRE